MSNFPCHSLRVYCWLHKELSNIHCFLVHELQNFQVVSYRYFFFWLTIKRQLSHPFGVRSSYEQRLKGLVLLCIWHTRLWQLRNRGKCNCQRVYCMNVQRDVGARLNQSCSLRAPPSRGRGVSQVMLPNVVFGLLIVFGQSSFWSV